MRTDGIARLRVVVGWVIVAVWCGSFILDAVLPTYDPPTPIHGLMLLVAGALFGPSIAGRNGRRDA